MSDFFGSSEHDIEQQNPDDFRTPSADEIQSMAEHVEEQVEREERETSDDSSDTGTDVEEEKVSMSRVRKWAQENGIDVPARGKISDSVVEQYKNRDKSSPVESKVDEQVKRSQEPWRKYSTKKPGERRIEKWHRGDDVKWVQKIVGVEPTGDYDDDTENAVQRYQAAVNQIIPFTVDGVVDRETWGQMRGSNFVSRVTLKQAYRYGQRDSAGVIETQARLASRGYYTGKIDGVPSAKTKDAYRRFQRDVAEQHGVTINSNGEPDRFTLEQLGFRITE